MFTEARVKLTFFYLVIIMLITGVFSVAFFRVSTQELQRIIDRVKFEQQRDLINPPPQPGPPPITLAELEQSKNRLLITLIVINGVILVLAGGSGFFLAGKTLKPIQRMVDEQNQFISDASHELRTPIAVLRAEMEEHLLEPHISDQEARDLIGSNLEELNSLQALATSLLKINQLERKDEQSAKTNLAWDEIVAEVAEKMEPLAKKKKITINQKLVPATVMGNKENLEELLIIIIDNAIKYSKNNSKVTIEMVTKANDVEVKISDEGIGISEKDINHIFDRFYRADQSRKQKEGYGLGLAIAKKIAELHRGSIEVKSRINQGSTFVITLPQVSVKS